jgi:hypothetical protein
MAGMRFQDYIDRLDEDDRKDVLKNLDREESKLRKFLERFDENQLNGISIMMNETFEMPCDELSVVDFIVELYKCQKADFLYENVGECIDCMRMLESASIV